MPELRDEDQRVSEPEQDRPRGPWGESLDENPLGVFYGIRNMIYFYAVCFGIYLLWRWFA